MTRQDWSMLLLGVLAGLVVVLPIVALVVSTADSGEDDSEDDPRVAAGPPFSIAVQQDLLRFADAAGMTLDVEEGRCEVLAQVVEQLPRDPGHSALTRREAAAAAGPAGAIRVTIEQATQDPEVLSAVGDCVPYYVGR